MGAFAPPNFEAIQEHFGGCPPFPSPRPFLGHFVYF